MALQQFSDEHLLDALRAVAADFGEPLSKDTYAAHSGADRPSWALIVQRMGSWNAACIKAGLKVNAAGASYKRTWTRERVVEAVREFLAESSAASFAAYVDWARGRDAAPSGQTVRNVLGSWQAAKDASAARCEKV